MPAGIDQALVHHIARLSRLHLNSDEARLYASQLTEIVGYLQQIQAIDTEKVEPLAHPVSITNVLRDDQPGGTLSATQALANAPDSAGQLFKVPAVLDPAIDD
ncbi:MAG: Asp-tRNA(Asn)/Glu-tRNA(Gln) amidotransferase subunit GatC [Planctomycetota bacterium]